MAGVDGCVVESYVFFGGGVGGGDVDGGGEGGMGSRNGSGGGWGAVVGVFEDACGCDVSAGSKDGMETWRGFTLWSLGLVSGRRVDDGGDSSFFGHRDGVEVVIGG